MFNFTMFNAKTETDREREREGKADFLLMEFFFRREILLHKRNAHLTK